MSTRIFARAIGLLSGAAIALASPAIALSPAERDLFKPWNTGECGLTDTAIAPMHAVGGSQAVQVANYLVAGMSPTAADKEMLSFAPRIRGWRVVTETDFGQVDYGVDGRFEIALLYEFKDSRWQLQHVVLSLISNQRHCQYRRIDL